MPDAYDDVYSDIYGGTAGVVVDPPATTGLLAFDGVTAPEVLVDFAFGATSTADLAAAGTFILNDSTLGGTDTLGSVSWVSVVGDVVALEIRVGQDDETSGASVGTCSVTVENYSGAYDPTIAEFVDLPSGVFPSVRLYPSTSLFPDELTFPDQTGAQQVDVGKPMRVRYRWGSTTYSRFTGQIDDITLDAGYEPTVTFSCVDGLESLGRAKIPELPAPLFAGDRADQRINRILNLAGFPSSRRSLEVGLLTLAATDYGDFALPLLQEVADSELGTIAVDPDGKFQFFNRLHVYTATRSTTVQATFSDVGTDVDMLQLQVSKSRSRLFNEARVTRDGGVEQVASDSASQTAYGIRSYPGQVGTLAPTDADALSLASWLVGRYSRPHAEVRQVTVDATAQGMWSVLLPLRPLDRIRVIRDYGPVTLDRELVIRGMQETVSQAQWQFSFSTTNVVDFAPFILGTSTLGGPNQLA